jgi:hypothetical protein
VRRAPLGEPADPAAAIRARDPDVEPRHPHRPAGAAKTTGVAELGDDHRRGRLADPEAALGERPTARPAAREPPRLALDRRDPLLERIAQRAPARSVLPAGAGLDGDVDLAVGNRLTHFSTAAGVASILPVEISPVSVSSASKAIRLRWMSNPATTMLIRDLLSGSHCLRPQGSIAERTEVP